eukprot:67001-Pyramimonas_sp.AAC.1
MRSNIQRNAARISSPASDAHPDLRGRVLARPTAFSTVLSGKPRGCRQLKRATHFPTSNAF